MDRPAPVALITGAGSGIGRATAMLLAERGWQLALVGRREEPLRETAALSVEGARVLVIAADVGEAAQAIAAVDAAVAHFGRLDGLVNNAGYAPLLDVGRTSPEVLDQVYRINALGPATMIARAWPVMVRQRGGRIVNVSSMASLDPYPGFFAYAGAKAAVNSMARSCAGEGAAHGIRAFAVAPGAVETAMLRAIFPESSLPHSACLSPESVAGAIVACLEGRHDDRSGDTITMSAP